MPPSTLDRAIVVARRFTLAGRVQGRGVRPAIARLARRANLGGYVRNTDLGVEVVARGPAKALDVLQQQLAAAFPSAAIAVEDLSTGDETLRCAAGGDGAIGEKFEIRSSHDGGPPAALVPPDALHCADCWDDVRRAGDRRQDYAFTTCAECGPRYTLIAAMPYDRAATGMREFLPCTHCNVEYQSLDDRRGHAQTIACPACGPRLTLHTSTDSEAIAHDVIAQAVAWLNAEKIVALRGIGGYQLLCAADSAAAVARLRQRKGRRTKPLAVMAADLAQAEELAVLDDVARAALLSPAGPIVVAPRRGAAPLAAAIAPGRSDVGVMLPSSPLHALLSAAAGRPLVVTSGNREDQPLAYRQGNTAGLWDLADALLDHNRPILRPIDDSVVRCIAGRCVTLRLGRGLAPLPLDVEITLPLAAVGGQQKVALALANGRQAALGPHLGDLDELAARNRFVKQYRDLCQLYGAAPAALAHDLHPDYFTTRWAAESGLPTVAVQHHHAHVAAAMLEHGWLDRPVLGVAWDGTGYGTDGDVWGGEILQADVQSFRRVAHLRPFALPGGELAIRQPWRVAVALAVQAVGPVAASRLPFPGVGAEAVAQVAALAQRPALCPQCTSAGRLFDAAAALLLDCCEADYEGQPAELLEAAADVRDGGAYDVPLVDDQLDWRPLVARLIEERRNTDAARQAMRFLRGLARAIVQVCRRHAEGPVVLTGGVFQNRRLVEAVCEAWPATLPLGLPGVIPPGDGGLAAGQLVVAAARLGKLRWPAIAAQRKRQETAACV